MINRLKAVTVCFLAPFIILACSADRPFIKDTLRYKKPDDYNFKLIGYDYNIDNPLKDRRCYYKVYINKLEAGRTTIGLESQDKVFTSKLGMNRHLLIIEKWVLNEREKKYIKLNNIEQPHPNYVYFGIQKDKITLITMRNNSQNNKAEYKIDFEYRN